jgi:hypothetical protein
VAAWVSAQLFRHRPLATLDSPFLGSSGRRTLLAAFEALLPTSDGAEEMVDEVDRALAEGDPILAGQLRVALRLLEHLGGGGMLSFGRFSRLRPARRADVIAGWRRSSFAVKRKIAGAVQRVVMFTYYTRSEAWARIGYDGPWVTP